MKIKAKIKLYYTYMIGWFTWKELKAYEAVNRVVTVYEWK